MSSNAFKLNPGAKAEFKSRLDAFAAEVNPRNPEGLQKLGKRVMKSVLRTAVTITPPAMLTGQAFSDRRVTSIDRERGERSIKTSLERIFRIVQRKPKAREPMAAFHQAHRSPKTGRTFAPLSKQAVTQAEFNAYYKSVIARVGLLLSGWIEAAAALKLPLPAWVKRHGGGSGSYIQRVSAKRLHILIVNNVPYSGQLNAINHIMEQTLKIEAGNLQRQLIGLLERKARRFARK